MFIWQKFLTQSPDGLLHGNSNQDNAMNAINTVKTSQGQQQGQLANLFGPQYTAANASDTALKGQITDSYSNYLNPDNINSMFSNLDNTQLDNFANGSFTGDSYIPGVSGGIDDSLITGMGAVPYAGFQALSTGGNDAVNPNFTSDFNTAMGGVDTATKSYSDFMANGGLSDADVAAMTAAGIAPTRQIYANASANMDTANARAGGNLGNIGAVQAKTANDEADQIGQVNTNTLANVAQLKQQGKEFGTTGMAQTSLAKAQAETAVQQLDAQLKQAGLAGMTDIEKTRLSGELSNAQINEQAGAANAQVALGKAGITAGAINTKAGIDLSKAQLPLSATQGLTQLYGTTPGSTALSQNGLLQLQSLIQSGNLGLLQSQIAAGKIPSGLSSFLGSLSSIFGLVGTGAGAVGGLQDLYPGSDNGTYDGGAP